ncbi:AIR carboxylase family protein, partial [Staphylococcus aureus]
MGTERTVPQVVIITGSESDRGFVAELIEHLGKQGVHDTVWHIASAHRQGKKVLELIEQYEGAIFITVAGRSNALS